MISVSETTTLNHPPTLVFDVAADPDEQLKWDPGGMQSVEKLGAGPLAKGSRYRGKFKGFGTVEYEYADYDPPRRFTHLAKNPMGMMRHTLTFESVPDGTRLTQQGTLEDPTVLGRLGGPMVKMMLRRRFRLIAAELTDYLGRRGSGAA